MSAVKVILGYVCVYVWMYVCVYVCVYVCINSVYQFSSFSILLSVFSLLNFVINLKII